MNHRIGAHLSTSGGYTKALESIVKKDGNCLQIFSSSPRTWADSTISPEDIALFVEMKKNAEINPVYFHACYLINCADVHEVGQKSVKSLIFELQLAHKLGIRGSIVHTGSFKDSAPALDNYLEIRSTPHYQSLLSNIKSILKETPEDTSVILENAGNRKIGRTIDQLANILEDLNDDRVKVCLDTCHLHAAGYDLNTQEHFEGFIDLFDKQIGLSKLELVHMNDSRDPLGALRDRHDNIGEGHVGIDVFRNFLNHPKTRHLPFIIETPGFDDTGPDKKNIDILKDLIES